MSPATAAGLIRGRPRPVRLTALPPSACAASAPRGAARRWPGSPSACPDLRPEGAAWWSSRRGCGPAPPDPDRPAGQDRPEPPVSRSAVAGRRLAPAACWWPHHRPVHKVQQPVQLAAGVRVGLQRGQDPVPDALTAPAVNRLATVSQGPNWLGRSRHGAPVRSSHTIASTIRRWSFGGRPIRGRCGSSTRASLAHCASVSSRVVHAMGANSTHLSHQHCKHALAAMPQMCPKAETAEGAAG